ncbi:MAG: hypothetical protein ACI9GH_000393, partial [Candidatus Paceibacteria bacterium]
FYGIVTRMKAPDPDKEKGEKKTSINEFMKFYNENLPSAFPRATLPFLKEFRKSYSGLFKGENSWSLDVHRKKFMDWRPQKVKPTDK